MQDRNILKLPERIGWWKHHLCPGGYTRQWPLQKLDSSSFSTDLHPMISPGRIGSRCLEKWVRTRSGNKDCEFVGILRGLPYLTSFYNITMWFVCNLFTGYKDNYAKQAGEERLKPMLIWPMSWKSWTTTLLRYVILRPHKFSKKTFPSERNEAK